MRHPDGAVAIGIDVGGTKLVAGTVAADGAVLDRRRERTPAGDADALVATLVALVAGLGGGVPVGVGVAGIVDGAGVLRYGTNVGVRNLPVRDRLTAATALPVTVGNEATLATLGEQRAGAGRGHRDVVMFTVGTGVGGGVVVAGRLVTGARGYAGELGHLVVSEGGRRCPCGNRGCVEAYAAGPAMVADAQERLAGDDAASVLRTAAVIDGKAVTNAARDGDGLAIDVIEAAGHWLGVAMAGAVNALDPEVVVVGGGAAVGAGPWLLPAAETAMRARLLGRDEREPPAVVPAALGDDAGMVGAGLLAADATAAAGRGPGPAAAAP